MDNQITRKSLIIKSFKNNYLLDNYFFKDLIIKIKGINFRIQVKNAFRCNSQLRKSSKKSPNQTKIGKEAWHPRGPIDTLRVPISRGGKIRHDSRTQHDMTWNQQVMRWGLMGSCYIWVDITNPFNKCVGLVSIT